MRPLSQPVALRAHEHTTLRARDVQHLDSECRETVSGSAAISDGRSAPGVTNAASMTREWRTSRPSKSAACAFKPLFSAERFSVIACASAVLTSTSAAASSVHSGSRKASRFALTWLGAGPASV
jgi:hypothetical protein